MKNELMPTFTKLKSILKKYENPLLPKIDLDSKYDLWSFKDIVVAGKKRKEIFFAGLIIQSNYVGFYYMPIYTDESLRSIFKPELLKTLKGKSCFHIKKLDSELELQIEDALEKGYALYLERGWI